MCGIFGYAGPDANPEILIEGIKRLEYRGYDSWGVCVAFNDQLSMLRRVGRTEARSVLPPTGLPERASPTRAGPRTGRPRKSTRTPTRTAPAKSPSST